MKWGLIRDKITFFGLEYEMKGLLKFRLIRRFLVLEKHYLKSKSKQQFTNLI